MLPSIEFAASFLFANFSHENNTFAVEAVTTFEVEIAFPVAGWFGAFAPVRIVNVAVIGAGPSAPLLKEKGDVFGGTLIAQGSSPVRVHGIGFVAAFSPRDYPVNALA